MKKADVLLLGAVVFGLLLAAAVGWRAQLNQDQLLRETFVRDVDDKATSLHREIVLYFEVLHMLKGLYDASSFVSRNEFARITRDVIARHPNIQALEWVPRVVASERSERELKARESFKDFQFTELAPQGHLRAAEARDEYFPIYYLEPLAGNEAALGFDLESSPQRRSAMARARDTGQLTATGAIQLVQARNEEIGILILLPVYDGEPHTLEGRRAKIKGFVVGAFNASSVFSHAINQTGSNGIHIRVVDATPAETTVTLYDNNPHHGVQSDTTLTHQRAWNDMAGRRWLLQAHAQDTYLQRHASLLPVTLFALMSALTLGGGIVVLTSIRQAGLIRRVVDERTRQLNSANEKLDRLSRTDSLTGLANRRQFDEYLQREWRRAVREHHPIALMMVDIDCFKQYNDYYGHQAGDACLKNVAGALQSTLRRPSDLAARYGGEEFAIVLAHVDEGTRGFADLVRASVEALRIPHPSSSVSNVITVSIGIAIAHELDPLQAADFIRAADRALYQAKATGRNRVIAMDIPVIDGPDQANRD